MGEPQRVLFDPTPPRGWPSCALSDCGCYRYELRIPLGREGGMCLFVLANPSTAVVTNGVFQSDPNVTRCINFAKAWNYGTAVVANVRAWRETNPKLVPSDPLAIGPENDRYITTLVREADLVVCGWGRLGGARGPAVLEIIRRAGKVPHALKLTPDGVPHHPLYLRNDAKPIAMEAGHG